MNSDYASRGSGILSFGTVIFCVKLLADKSNYLMILLCISSIKSKIGICLVKRFLCHRRIVKEKERKVYTVDSNERIRNRICRLTFLKKILSEI